MIERDKTLTTTPAAENPSAAELISSDAPLTRRGLMRVALALGAAATLGRATEAHAQPSAGPQDGTAQTKPVATDIAAMRPSADALHERPALAKRRFTSPAVEAAIVKTKKLIADPQLAQIFENCLPNTLDTTVFPGTFEGKPDTFVITGDIDAMWLRDSSAQLWPYLQFCKQDPKLSSMIEGVIRRQTRCIALDPYANAFLRDEHSTPLSWSTHDLTDMKPGVGERKYELDTLCYPIRLAHGYWEATGNTAPFDAAWLASAKRVVRTMREQQRKDGPGPYHFQRTSPNPTETQALNGYGFPAMPVGLVYSGFRPSDDACIYPLFVPANLFAANSLRKLAVLASKVAHDAPFANECTALADEITAALAKYGQVDHPTAGRIWAFEVDGYGNAISMDDANAPGLLSLAYLGCVENDDALFRRTRAFSLSKANPYFFAGKAAEGVGGPHQGLDFIWPMSILFRAFSSSSDAETLQCLAWLRDTTAGTNFMHESFHKDDPKNYTRPWFAWANTLFGELILKVAATNPALLGHTFA